MAVATSDTAGREVAIPAILVKPYTGHTLGASGLLDIALLSATSNEGRLFPNVRGLTNPSKAIVLASEPQPLQPGTALLKLSVGMGGHNAAIVARVI